MIEELEARLRSDGGGGEPMLLPMGISPSSQIIHSLQQDKDRQAKEFLLLRKTIDEMELRIDTQKQTLNAREESIKKLLEMLQNKGEPWESYSEINTLHMVNIKTFMET